jgi:hypothetical protein
MTIAVATPDIYQSNRAGALQSAHPAYASICHQDVNGKLTASSKKATRPCRCRRQAASL